MALVSGLTTVQATITNGGSLSAAIPLGAMAIVGIAMPSGWDSASLTFQASIDGGTTWLEMSQFSTGISVAALQYVSVEVTYWLGVNHIKVRSGTSGSAVNQTADRVITLVLRPVA